MRLQIVRAAHHGQRFGPEPGDMETLPVAAPPLNAKVGKAFRIGHADKAVVVVLDRQVHLGMRLEKLAKARGQPAACEHRQKRHAHRARPLRDPLKPRADGRQPARDMLRQQAALLGRLQAAGSAPEKDNGQIVFQFFDVIADRALADVQLLRGTGHVPDLKTDHKHLNRIDISDNIDHRNQILRGESRPAILSNNSIPAQNL